MRSSGEAEAELGPDRADETSGLAKDGTGRGLTSVPGAGVCGDLAPFRVAPREQFAGDC